MAVAEAVKVKSSPQTSTLPAQGSLLAVLSPALTFLPPQHRRTSETSISPPGSSIGSPNRVICVSPALPLAQGPRDGNSNFWACPTEEQHGNLGKARTSPPVPAAHCATSAVAQLRSAQRGTVLPSQLLCPPHCCLSGLSSYLSLLLG